MEGQLRLATKKREDGVKTVLKAYEERKDGHGQFCRQVDRDERAYMALMRRGSDPDQWESNLTPPYAMQVIDTVVANLSDDRSRMLVRPLPKMASADEIERHIKGARAHELLLSHQLDRDRYSRKKAAFVMQGAIAGVTCMKVHWATETMKTLTHDVRQEPQYDDYGQHTGYEVVREDVEEEIVVRDGPTVTVVRIEDFMWEEGAVELERSPWLIHRVPQTMDEVRRLAQMGVYSQDAVRELERRHAHQGDFSDEFVSLDEELYGDKRFKDRVEILEYWCRHDGVLRCITVANRKVVLADRRHLFAHGMYPFVTCATRPLRFRIPGRSIVGSIRQLQEYQWSLMNQRLDNLRLINNAIFAYRDDLLDRDLLEFYPGAMWPMSGDVNEAVKMFSPDPTAAVVSLQAEANIKGDLQNATGGMPFMSGTESSTIDQTTATGVSIVTSLAQRMLAYQKQYIGWAEEEIGQQMLSLNQQFIQTEQLIPIIGMDGATAFEAIGPDVLAGTYHVAITPATESLMRQERRAEAQAKLQVASSIAPIAAAMGVPLNIKAFIEDYLIAFETDNLERYFSAAPQPGLSPPGAPGQPSPPGQPGAPSPNGGVTAPPGPGVDVASALQQMMAQAGGAANGG